MPNITEGTDAAASTRTTYGLAVGQTAEGTLGSGADHDWYRVSLTAGQTYTFAVVGTGGSGLDDSFLVLRNSRGGQIAFNDDGGPGSNSTITFTAASSGTYYIDVGSYNNESAGQYGLSFTAGSRAHYDEMMGAGNLIRGGASWAATPATAANVTYSFDTANPDQTDASGYATAFIALTAAQRTAAQSSLSFFSDVGNITFTQAAANTGAMRFSAYISTTDGAGAYAYYPGTTGAEDVAGDVNLNNDSVSTTSIPTGSYSFFAILHEIGHAMGLSHPGDYNAAPGVDITYANSAQFIEDTHQYTVMSYFDESNTTATYNSYPDTLLMYDILAIQQLYGVNYNTRSGDSVYGFNANTGSVYDFTQNTDPVFCIWDGAGSDTIDASLYSMAQRINLNAGTFSNIGGFSGNISIAIGAIIENAIGGSGNDTLIGNSSNNVLDGRAGTDTLNGGAGNDTYVLGAENDTVIDSAGTDTITSTITRSLAGYAMIENLTLVGSDNINGTGNSLANTLLGNSGNNVLDGGAGADTLDGGDGDDTYVLGSESDTVIDSDGTDTITSTITRSLLGYATIENLTLLGSSAINGTGNSLANVILGNSGNNVLDGGAGADTLNGGAGNDTYVMGSEDDTIIDSAGTDTITSTITRSLAGYATIENLTLLGSSAINGTGNGLANVILGNTGNNVLDGGAGTDTLNGGAGNDTYILGAENDTIVDSAGTDTITSTITRSLAGYAMIENLTLVGSDNVNGTGNGLANVILGNTGNNVLNGGAGADTLDGGDGDDTYVLGSESDTVIDSAGTDTITSTITRSLLGYATIENLTLLGSSAINGTGNGLANVILGNTGNNVLDGGAGADTLNGGAGNDTYVLGAENDTVIDSAGTDTITSTITRSLAGYATIENLTLLGTANIDGTGNALKNLILGNSGDNVLDGGAGADTLNGGAGNDTYVLGSESDKVIDSAGIDTITSTITRSLAGYAMIENLTLLGSGNIDGTGNGLNNVLTGNTGNNVLNGGAGADTLDGGDGNDRLFGGLGNDTLTGGAGADIFVFNTALNASSNVDRITDFSVADDTIWLENSVMKALGATGTLASGAFASNISGLAEDASDRIIYESDTGNLYYDSNGNAAGGSVLIGVLSANLLLTYQDFSVI